MKKVIVGLSGGVDSAVAAHLLIKEGYQVEALFMRNWDSGVNNDFLGNNNNPEICPQEIDYNDAKQVAEKLGIKLHRVDFIKEYWDFVFKFFIDEYEKGRTPNPDILCNKYIKFNMFLNYAVKELGADYIATGHYAGVRYNEKTKNFELLKGKDNSKDQSYFLSELDQDKLSKTIFPLYKYSKPEIRKIAKDNNLHVSEKKDSTGICFIGERKFTEFLQNYISNQPGDIVDIKTNKVIGKHIGAMYYTIGQRKGLNLGGQKEPYYVSGKDIDKKIIFVCPLSDDRFLNSDKCEVEEFNWIVEKNKYFKENKFSCTAKFRYRQPDVKVTVELVDENNIKVIMDKPIRAVTPGQECVLYLDEICLGGGKIK